MRPLRRAWPCCVALRAWRLIVPVSLSPTFLLSFLARIGCPSGAHCDRADGVDVRGSLPAVATAPGLARCRWPPALFLPRRRPALEPSPAICLPSLLLLLLL